MNEFLKKSASDFNKETSCTWKKGKILFAEKTKKKV